tara:strand:- start:300 stop:1367 length:1068 start_codon:yes stop_codon:yes gene_type:complete
MSGAGYASFNDGITLKNGIFINNADASATSGYLYNDSNDFIVRSYTQDKDIIFKGNDGGSVITALTLDMSESGTATFNKDINCKNLKIPDNEGAYFGTGNDLAIYHDGSDSYILDQGTGNLLLQSSSLYYGDASGTHRGRFWLDGSTGIGIGRTTNSWNNNGCLINDPGFAYFERDTSGNSILYLHRRGSSNDGNFIQFWKANSLIGDITNSGGTVSLTGFQGSHASSGTGVSSSTAVGTVVSTIDEEHSERHAKIKVSDSVGDKRVYGTLEKWIPETTHENGQTTAAYALVASTGVGSVKVTGACEGGDLLESNGDGTAKVQSDDIVRSKTIGKVTIGNSNTGVKLVSCVLYCG